MRELAKKVFVNTRNIERDSFIWNMVSAIFFAIDSAVLLMIINRVSGLEDSGIFSISYSVASMMLFLGEFGVRKYQASDVNEKYSFRDYYSFRIICCVAMVLACFLYGFYGIAMLGYSAKKFIVLIMVCMVRLVEAYNDVFFGRFQQLHRLDISAKTNAFRIAFGMLCFALSLLITKNILLASVIWFISAVLGYLVSTHLVYPEFCDIKFAYNGKTNKNIAIECLPLFLASFLLLYIGNAPKYAIDAHLTDEMQAKFNFIFMPVFVIGMLSNFIFNPILVSVAEAWGGQNITKFKKIVIRQVLIITGLTILAIAVALTIGCPVLGMLYGTDLSAERTELVVLMVGGGMLAMVNFLTVIATIIRYQRRLIFGYLFTALLALVLSGRLVSRYGLMGAAVIYTLLLSLLCLIFVIVVIASIKEGLRNRQIQS